MISNTLFVVITMRTIFSGVLLWKYALSDRHIVIEFRMRRRAPHWVEMLLPLLSVLSCMTGGCALPYQQLMLPEPASGSTHSQIGAASRASGVPLATAPSADALEPRVYKGSGNFFGEPDFLSNTGVEDSAKAVSLALNDASAPEAAKAILGDVLKVNYTVSDKVQGRISLTTPEPVSKEKLVSLFEQVLRSQGAAIVVEGDLYKIIPSNEAGPGAIAWSNSRVRPPSVGLTSETVSLRYVSVAEIERLLRSVTPQVQIVSTDAARNSLVISGAGAELQAAHDTIGMFDVDWMRGMSVAIHPVEAADPDAIAHELDTIFGNDRNSPIKGVVRFVPNQRLKAIIVISSRPEYLTKAASWIRRLDMAGAATQKQVNIYHVQNRPAAVLAKLLSKIYGVPESRQPAAGSSSPATAEMGSSILNGGTANGVASAANASVEPGTTPMTAAGDGSSITFAPQTFKPGQTAQNQEPGTATDAPAGSGASNPGSTNPLDDRESGIQFFADEENNALVITATANEYKRILKILARVDVEPNQVVLEATIAEVTLNDNLKYGLRWFFQHGNNKLSFTNSALGAISPVAKGFSYFLNTPDIQVALNALSTVTDVNVVSSPTLTVMDNKKAILQIGDEVPIVTQQAISVESGTAPIINSVSFRNTGVILNITPRISDNNRVMLDIEQEVSDAVATTTSGIDAPTIQQRRVKTTVAVNNGESIVLAGMMQDRTSLSRDQVPLVGNVPVLGNLFKSKDNTIKRTELLIAITPQVLRNPGQVADVTNELRDKLNFSTRPQRQAPPDSRENIDRLLVH